MQKGFIIILILAIIIAVFAISNSAIVPINLIFTEVMLSQAIVIFICVLLGAILAILFGAIRQLSLKKEIHELESKNEDLEKHVDELNRDINQNETQIESMNENKVNWTDLDEIDPI